MKKHFLNFFANVEKVPASTLDALEWDAFLYATGLPKFDPYTIYDLSLR